MGQYNRRSPIHVRSILEAPMHDLRLAVRALRATPIVSTVAALSLALGIGANTAIFSLVNTVLLRNLPVVDPERLATISSDSAIKLGFNAGLGWNYPMWDAFRPRAQAFDGALAWSWSMQQLNLAEAGEIQPVNALVTSGEFFPTLGVHAVLGRTLTAADDVRGGGPDGPRRRHQPPALAAALRRSCHRHRDDPPHRARPVQDPGVPGVADRSGHGAEGQLSRSQGAPVSRADRTAVRRRSRSAILGAPDSIPRSHSSGSRAPVWPP
jgi:hypothetical protein